MSTRASRALVVAAAVAALAALGPFATGQSPATTGPADEGARLLDNARRASQQLDFSGVLEVTWSDGRGEHSSEVFVRSADGVLALGDRPQVIMDGARRFVRSPDGWLAVWSDEIQADVPAASAKWELSVREGPTIAGRSTREVDATGRDDGLVRERLYLDASTNLLLRREQLDRRGRTVRTVGFTSIGDASGVFFGAAPADAPRVPDRTRAREPRVLDQVTEPFRAPGTAGDRFQLVGRYDEADDTVHLFYSDGLFSVSVFEQEGELDTSGLPAGAEPRTVDGHDVHQYRTPAGVALVWESDDIVYTTVSDAPLDQLDAIISDLAPESSPSTVTRVTNFVLGPFSW